MSVVKAYKDYIHCDKQRTVYRLNVCCIASRIATKSDVSSMYYVKARRHQRIPCEMAIVNNIHFQRDIPVLKKLIVSKTFHFMYP